MQTDFNTLLINHSHYLQPFAIALTRDTEAAKDLCQETLARALVNSDKYQLGTNIKSWLYTIMRNIFINDYRKKQKHPTLFPENLAGTLEADRMTSETALSMMEAKQIKEKINELPQIFHKPFLLYIEGYKYNEIANLLNEPLGTIKSRIHFAKKLLREHIQRN